MKAPSTACFLGTFRLFQAKLLFSLFIAKINLTCTRRFKDPGTRGPPLVRARHTEREKE